MSEVVRTGFCWINHNDTQLLIRISKETPDCTFRVKNFKNTLHSFKWMLKDISPLLKSIIENHGTCKEIPIDDPNFEKILTYAHTKIVDNQPLKELLSLYDSAYKFGINRLMDEITKILEGNIKRETQSFNKWMMCFELDYLAQFHDRFKKLSLDEMKKIFTEDLEKGLKVNIKKITTFSPGMFYNFLAALKTKGVDPFLCFDCLKVYLTDDKIPEIIKGELVSNNMSRDIIKTFLQNIDFSKISIEDVKNNIEKSELSDSKKKCLLEEIQHLIF